MAAHYPPSTHASFLNPPPPPNIAGSWLTAASHLITAIIGAGVLGLPNAVAWMGWVAGIACLVMFYAISLWTCTMLTDCYHVKGKRHTKYKWAVLHIMVSGGSREDEGIATVNLASVFFAC